MKYVVKPLLLALADMHAKGIVHRDIKPENLVMHDDNTILLCDFDLAIDSRAEVPCSQVRRVALCRVSALICWLTSDLDLVVAASAAAM